MSDRKKKKEPVGEETVELRILAVNEDGDDSDEDKANADRQIQNALQRPDPEEQARTEAFWAGRNSAMRRSARAAA